MFQNHVKLALLIITSLMSAVSVLAGDWAGLSPKGPVGIKIEAADGIFEQCSRPTPKPSGSLWLPNYYEIAQMEQRLTEHFRSLDGRLLSDPRWSLHTYRGQHVGFGIGPQRYIYGAYVDESIADTQLDGEAIVRCDGGPSAWGILYKVETGEFSDFRVNGR